MPQGVVWNPALSWPFNEAEHEVFMNRNAIAPFRSYVGLLVFLLAFVVIGCAGGSYSSPTHQAPEVLSVVQGAWEIQFHSAESNDYTVLELNLSQTGTKVFAGATGALLYHGTTLQTSIPLTSRGSKCDSGVVGQVTLDGMLTNQQSAAEKITFALTETGVLGTALITATASTDGAKISDGTYSIPAACGFPADTEHSRATKTPSPSEALLILERLTAAPTRSQRNSLPPLTRLI